MSDDEPTYTVGRLGELVGLSRTALLYYDAIGLLKPGARSASGYRLYSQADRERLERLLSLRALGITLGEIGPLLDLPRDGGIATLLKRLIEINDRIAELREQQRGILGLLEASGTLKRGRTAIGELADIGRKAGVFERNYRRIHRAFERSSPEEHRKLLTILGFSEAEIKEFLETLGE